ncbi:MAG: triacylglycerol lipase [Psychrobacter sp.]|nr:triacylglycerol lipase [Psychrobacter sp.]
MNKFTLPIRAKTAHSALWLSVAALGVMAASSAQAGSYYNCANPSGCVEVQNEKPKSDYDATKYPIVMAHGFLGWNRALGFLDYFNDIPQTLIQNGAEVYSTKTSTVNSVEVRGEQLAQQIRTITAVTGSDKVNLIGHSQGGLDARYAAGIDPQRVASITTVATPHNGAQIGDKISDWIAKGNADAGTAEGEFNINAKLLIGAFNAVGTVIDAASAGIPLDKTQEQSADGFIYSLSKDNFVRFNNKFPAPIPKTYCGSTPANNVMNGVGYYSFSGVGQITNILDPSDYILKVTSTFYDKDNLNDGLVAKCSSRVGYVIRDDYKMNHLDSINQFFGLVSWLEANPKAVYRQQINRLKVAGY